MPGGLPYQVAELIGAVVIVLTCLVARRWPGATALGVARGLAVVLTAEAAIYFPDSIIHGDLRAGTLPLQLCDAMLLIAAATCWWPRWQLGVELTYFVGLSGSLQGVLTPDLYSRFGQLNWFMFVIEHLAIVAASIYLVVGMGRYPRRGSPVRVFGWSALFTAVIGVIDWLTGANYMYLRAIPGHASLLSILGPWPYYIAGAGGLGVLFFFILDAPFMVLRHRARRAVARSVAPPTARSGAFTARHEAGRPAVGALDGPGPQRPYHVGSTRGTGAVSQVPPRDVRRGGGAGTRHHSVAERARVRAH